MTELDQAGSAIQSISSYLRTVKEYEIKLRNDALATAISGQKVKESKAVKDHKKSIRRFLNLARVIQSRYNRQSRLYKLDILERILAEDDAYIFSRDAISKIEMHSKLIIEGMRKRQSIYYSPEDIKAIVTGVKSVISNTQTTLRVEDELVDKDEVEASTNFDFDKIAREVMAKVTTTQIPDSLFNPPTIEEKDESKKE